MPHSLLHHLAPHRRAARREDQAPTQLAIHHVLVEKPLILVLDRQQPFNAFAARIWSHGRELSETVKDFRWYFIAILSIETTTR